MTATLFMAEWAVRFSVLILSGALVLWALRIKDPSIRLAAWTAVMCGPLAIPALTTALPEFLEIAAARSTTMEEMTAHLTRMTDRLVNGKTGSPEMWIPDATPWSPTVPTADGVPVAEDPAGPSIFTAL